MSARSRLIILSFALLGLGFATSSAWVHYKLLTDASYTSPCDINQVFNCSQVYLSRYGSVAGVPVALGGAFWFVLVALVAWMSTPKAASELPASPAPGGTYLFALATIGMAVILYLGYTSWFVLKTACVLCLGTYVAVAGIFIVAGRTAPVSVFQLPGRFLGDLTKAFRDPFVLVLTLLLFGGTAYALSVFPKEGTRPSLAAAPSPQQTLDFETAWFQQPRVDLGIPADGAKVVIVKFNDYMCGGCGLTYGMYKPVLEKFAQSDPGAIKYIVKDWPWDKQCNFYASTLHEAACEAAVAVRMARDHGPAKEKEMAEWLYDNQATLIPAPDLVKAGALRILGETDFEKGYRLKLPDIQKDIADGVALRVSSTPTMFINGVRIDRQLMPAEYFERAIKLELNKAAGK
jgi:uncharacterized membrane protein/protein-disulfide isomerase